MTEMPQPIDEDSWRGIIEALENLLPYYERTNIVNTWFLLPLWRRELSGKVARDDTVLEIGSGPGGLATLLKARKVVCLDPSREMLSYARNKLDGGRYRFASALAERLPFAHATFDKVLCSFSFRDFMDKPLAFREMLRVLRPGGRLHILELLRPDPGWRRAFMDAWIGKAVPTIARVLVPREAMAAWGGNPYSSFAMTYKAMSPIGEYVRMAGEAGFEDVTYRFMGMKSIFHLRGARPRTTS